MKLDKLIHTLEKMDIGAEKSFYTASEGTRFFVRRPAKKKRTLKHEYDLKTNVQIWAKEPGKEEFMPNHLRILIDLGMKQMYKPRFRKDMLLAFDRVYYGEDPEEIIKDVNGMEFPDPLRPLDYDLYMTQLFMAEQTVGYVFESKFDPKYLYLQGWIRATLSGELEIDKICWSATKSPPLVKFTQEDNKKHRMFNPGRKELWYLE